MSPASSSSSSRWCPTPEQLMILEEMYRSGIRTPNASQIQQITSHLSFYGKIEGKNVFYWFQNHKARERQKLRRKLGKQLQLQQQQQQQQQQLYYPLPLPHLFHYFDSPAASPLLFPQISSPNSAKFLPLQGGGGHEDASAQMMKYTWKVEKPSENVAEVETDNKKALMGKMYGRDWMMMVVDLVSPPPPNNNSSPCCAAAAHRPPLKTLELFPITATNLKEDNATTTPPPPTN
ncbi:hypothetical protein Dsin_020184 [Dipteronia sinensis]|uniref:Homeobox domain-containing protein n=1 Tax=Dipteronia sinensis TaxID=43782 RepID=A0AAE0A9Y5_9ROSI|nr:hypothetical protein Dsin_020184 [Dipteronia sinensis]